MSLHLYFGPMFSEKTSTLIREYNKYKVLGKNVLVINHLSDTRYTDLDKVVSHSQVYCNAVKLEKLINVKIDNVDVILIDEAQFFSDLVEACNLFLAMKKTIIVFGLDGSFEQKKFGSILDLIPIADSAKKLTAFCKECCDGTPAPFTKRVNDVKDDILVGSSDYYEAVCRKHLNV